MKYLLVILCVGIILYISLLGIRGLCEPDEGRYAEIAREMVEGNGYFQPRLNYIKHFHKPPLVYWLVSAGFLLFGVNEFTARLPVALLAVSGLIITFFLAASMGKGRKCAFLCSLVLATSLQYFIWSQVLAADMVFSFFIYLAIFGFWNWYRGKGSIYVLYLGIALAFMVKGPVAVILTFLIILIYTGLTKEWNLFKKIKLFPGIILFLILVSPWFIYVCIKNPGLSGYFVFNQSLNRLLTTSHGREGNLLYFIPVLLIGFLPWIIFIPGAVKRYKPWRKEDKNNLFMFLWIIIPVVFFSLSSSKLPGYILPVYPAMAILAGSYIYERGYLRAFTCISIITCILYITGIIILPAFEENLGDNLSIRNAAQCINEKGIPEDRVVNYRCFFQGLPFYVKRRVILVEKEREMQFENNVDSHKDYIFSDTDEFWGQLQKDERIWCFSPLKDLEDLEENSPVPLYEIWQGSGYVLVSNQTAS